MGFFNLLDPVLNYIDSGKILRQPFMWFYYLLGVLAALLCFYGVVQVCDAFKYMNGMGTLGLILAIIVLIAMALYSIIYWFKRASNVNGDVPVGARFTAIPAIANFIRCLGEWWGIAFGVGGAVICLFLGIFAAKYYGGGQLFLGILICPIMGYVTLVFFRFLSESLLAIASIANDVHELATFNPPVENNY